MERGYSASLAAILRWKAVLGIMSGSGYSQQTPIIPNRILKIWRIGAGLTATSRVLDIQLEIGFSFR